MAERKLIIAGTGCAGHTAAIYAARAGLEPLVLEGDEPGGQLSLTSEVENFPGFPDGVGGFDLVHAMRRQAERFGAVYESGRVTALRPGSPLEVEVGERVLTADAFIVATGARARRLGIPGEAEWFGNGVSTCATCDGAFYRGQRVVVVGGGDSAVEEALFLTRFASHVDLVHRRDTLRASKIMQDRVREHPAVQFHWNSEVVAVLGEEGKGVVGVEVLHHPEGNPSQHSSGVTRRRIETDGFFLAIGHVPNSDFLRDVVDLDSEGYVVTVVGPSPTENVRTKVPGVFACGDVVDRRYRQAVTAAGMGCAAAMEAERWLAERLGE